MSKTFKNCLYNAPQREITTLCFEVALGLGLGFSVLVLVLVHTTFNMLSD